MQGCFRYQSNAKSKQSIACLAPYISQLLAHPATCLHWDMASISIHMRQRGVWLTFIRKKYFVSYVENGSLSLLHMFMFLWNRSRCLLRNHSAFVVVFFLTCRQQILSRWMSGLADLHLRSDGWLPGFSTLQRRNTQGNCPQRTNGASNSDNFCYTPWTTRSVLQVQIGRLMDLEHC